MTDPKRDFYSSISSQFDELVNRYDEARRLEVFFRDLLPTEMKGQRVLDAGCGTGLLSLEAQHRGAWVACVDISPLQLQVAKRKGLHRVAAGDGLCLPFRDGVFDIVMSSEMIEHTVDPEAAVTELVRVLRSPGLLAVTCPNRRWKWLVDTATLVGLRPFAGYENFLTFARLGSVVESLGLSIEQHMGFHPWPFQLTPLQGVSRHVDRRWGKTLWGRWMINQAVLARKV